MSADPRPAGGPAPAGSGPDVGPPGTGGVSDRTSTGLDSRTAAVFAYLAWWLTGALFLALEPAHPFVRFHARQALVVFGLIWLVGIAVWLASLLSMFLSPLLFPFTAVLAPAVWVGGLALWAVCLVQAWRGRWWSVPGLGSRLVAREPRP